MKRYEITQRPVTDDGVDGVELMLIIDGYQRDYVTVYGEHDISEAEAEEIMLEYLTEILNDTINSINIIESGE